MFRAAQGMVSNNPGADLTSLRICILLVQAEL
jgi:hypothetical protein